jgi:hypothetical protein
MSRVTTILTSIKDGRLVIEEQTIEIPDGPVEFSKKEMRLIDPGPEDYRSLSSDDQFLLRCMPHW